MKSRTPSLRALLLSGWMIAALGARASAQDADLEAIWKDPVFKRQFVAGYGFDSEVEPRITPEEVAILEKIRPLMGTDLPKAEETLRSLMKPGCSAALDLTLGGLQFQQDKLTEALASYRGAVDKFPSFRRAWHNLGLIYSRNSNYDAAIGAFTRMIELGGGDAYAYGFLGISYAAKQDYQPAETAFTTALLLQPDNNEWRVGLTSCVLRQEKFQDAAALLDVLIERYPDNPKFWLLQAQAFLNLKQPLRAAQDLEAIEQLGNATVDSQQTLGDIYVSEELMGLAVRAYLRAIDLDANQPLARPLHAVELLAAHGARAQARQVTAHIHEVWDKQMAEADRRKLLKLEARLSMAEGADSPETAAVLEEMVKLDPLDGEALMLLGQHYARQKEPDRAMLYFERAESIEAVEVNARLRHAEVLVSMSRYADALPLLRRVQEIKPREDVARYLDQVERLSKSRH